MIESEYTFGTTTLFCDLEGCNNEHTHDGFDGRPDFKDAIQDAKSYGWLIVYHEGEWLHFCSTRCKSLYFKP